MRISHAVVLITVLFGCSVQAESVERHRVVSNQGSADVLVDMPSEVWTRGQQRQQQCVQCCTYEYRFYSEGAVVKAEGVLLQCSRDEKSLGYKVIWLQIPSAGK